MQTFVTVIHIITCVLLVLVVMIQSGKGAEISASFSGSSQTVFGSSGGANFFTRFTQGAAALFMITSLTLTIMGGQNRRSLFEGAAPPPGATQPMNQPKGAPVAPGANALPAGPGPMKTATSPQSATAPGALKNETTPQGPARDTSR